MKKYTLKDKGSWYARYHKKADMLIIGTDFTDGAYYDFGDVMIRINDKNEIEGIAIENTRYKLKKKFQKKRWWQKMF